VSTIGPISEPHTCADRKDGIAGVFLVVRLQVGQNRPLRRQEIMLRQGVARPRASPQKAERMDHNNGIPHSESGVKK